jgi:hypothetical protein
VQGSRKSSQDYPVKILKGVKTDGSGAEPPADLKDQRYLKLDLTNSSYIDKEKQREAEIESMRKRAAEPASANKYLEQKSFTLSRMKADCYYDEEISSRLNKSNPNAPVHDHQTGSFKKSISFSKHLLNENTTTSTCSSSSSNCCHNDEESSKLLAKSTHGLLTTVANAKSNGSANFSLHNRMVTFGNTSTSGTIPRGLSQHQSKPYTLNNRKAGFGSTSQEKTLLNNSNAVNSNSTTNTNSTTTTSTSADEDNINSSNSPTASSSLESSIPSPNQNGNHEDTVENETKLTVSDQSYSQLTVSRRPPAVVHRPLTNPGKLTTFGPGLKASPKRFVNSAGGKTTSFGAETASSMPVNALYSNSIQSEFADTFETKYLNKMCEDIEVSLNVDCECADDYSSNDFSGDYSFDNHGEYVMMMKPYAMIPPKTNFSGKKPDILVNRAKLGGVGAGKVNSASSASTSNASNDRDSTLSSSSAKSQLGVLV